MKTKNLTLCAVFTALLCILSIITIPIGTIPITLSTLAVMLCGVILGAKKGLVSVILYILTGMVGIPIFSGLRGGFQVVLGPTGGFILGYIPMVIVIGLLTSRLPQKKLPKILSVSGACFLGVIICYAFGTLYFMHLQHVGFYQAALVCVVPFIPFDILKSLFTGYITQKLTYLIQAR